MYLARRNTSFTALIALAFSAMFLAFALAACSGASSSTSSQSTSSTSSKTTTTSPEQATTPENPYATGMHHAKIEVADYGTIEVELNATVAPITVTNFAKLVNEGFYDGLTFHRIKADFVVQGGDPQGTGKGGSGEDIVGEFNANGYFNPITHVRGTVSMARNGADYNSASSQFFIMLKTDESLDGKYAAFGHVTSGMDVVDKMAADAQPTDSNGSIAADQQPVITSIKMID